MPWVMLVDTAKYFEGTTGAAGFSPLLPLALLPLAKDEHGNDLCSFQFVPAEEGSA